ncbi:HpcH/HpaI aldolase/citrate lyase family protein [Amycolatopsis sp. NPDC051903]|uniref:HpcH/HpaI aldolase/citrate lyase family protein n=1 Tax=Amycolatopsis sp. NPDC051903 TaxID=3363936 RepID=UPI0037B415D5
MRTLLFVPGNRPDRFAKAAASGADAVLCDLEDAVAPDAKSAARDAVVGWVRSEPAVVRVNAADTPWHAADLAALRGLPGVLAVVLPKASPDAVAATASALGEVPVWALIETARGIRDADAIASVAARLVFGNVDFGLDAAVTATGPDERELLYARSRLVIASRAADLPAPLDGVTTDLDDPAAAATAARLSRNLGFGGKLCLHPKQVAAVREAFAPSAEELAWARSVVEAAGSSEGAAVRVDGQMIDRPRLELARRLLAE